MIGYRHVLNSIGKLFTQLLSSLNLIDGVPIGMADEIYGNNAVFTNNNCFQGNTSGIFKLLQDNFSTLQHFKIDVWVRAVNAISGAELSGGWVTKYNFSATSSFQLAKPDSNGPMLIQITDSQNIGYTCNIVSNSDILNSMNGEFFKATVKIYGVNVEGYYNDALTDSITMTDVMRLVNVPFVIGGTNQGANLINDKYQIVRFKLTELNSLGIEQGILSDIQFSGHEFNTPSTDIVYDVSGGGNYASPVNIVLANKGVQDKFAYFQKGFLNTVPKVSILTDESAFADGSLLTDPNAVYEPGAFLNSGNTIKNADVAELKSKDIYNLWYDGGGNPKSVTFAEIETAIATYPDVYGGDIISGKSIKNISLK